jgi:hypothetical protein
MKMVDSLCPLCHERLDRRHRSLVYGLDVCDQCRFGDLDERVGRGRGWVLRSTELSLGDHLVSLVKVTAVLPEPSAVNAVFVEERFRHRLVKLVSRELQAGSEIFDERIYIRTTSPDATRALLERTDVRGALLELVGQRQLEGESSVVISGAKLEAKVPGDRSRSSIRALVSLCCCVILHHLEALTPKQPPSPYR